MRALDGVLGQWAEHGADNGEHSAIIYLIGRFLGRVARRAGVGEYETTRIEVSTGVATITIDRPHA